MHWLQALDAGLFRFINLKLSNPVFDVVMPFLSGNVLFIPVVLLAIALLIWKGRVRGALCVAMLALIIWPGDSFICNTIKHAVERPRPFLVIPGTHLPAGRGGDFGMPSSHAANWFAATLIMFIYYRRSLWFMLPMALAVSFSRIYNGVHYPGDVLAGAILGAGYGAGGVWTADALWQWGGRRWFPLWSQKLPSLLDPDAKPPAPIDTSHVSADRHWLHLGYVIIAGLLLARLGYIASGIIQLSEDEAYQWVWSKHLALSYYSKPPLIAYTQFLGTTLWGDNAFGVRFFAPVIAAVTSLLVLRFFAREVNARAGFFLLLAVTAVPLLSAGAVLMTIDPLNVLFWTAAMLAGWHAIQENGTTRQWLWVGFWMGLSFLSKYTGLFQLLCWAVLFVLWKPARKHLRRPGPYLALLVNAIFMLPVLIWNAQHGWITVTHVAHDAQVGRGWHLTLKYFLEFMANETALLNPIFFVAMIWAAIAFWRKSRNRPLLLYFFCMGAPLFLTYLFYTFHSRVLPNWIAPSVIPLFCLMAAFWDERFKQGVHAVKGWLIAGLIIGLTFVFVVHDTDLIGRVAGQPLPVSVDPLRRVRSWRQTALVVGEARQELLADGKPVFIICGHYGITGLISFYLPEAREHVKNDPIVYYQSSDQPDNQFYFWPGYENRKSQNAIYVRQTDQPGPPPERLQKEFTKITDLGLRQIKYGNRVYHTIQLFDCYDLR